MHLCGLVKKKQWYKAQIFHSECFPNQKITNYPQKIGSQEPRQIWSIKTLDLKSSQNLCSFSVSIVVGSNFGKVRLGTMLVKEYFAWWDPVARRCHKPNSRRRIGPHTGMNKCFTIWYKYFEVKQLKLNTYLKHNHLWYCKTKSILVHCK